MLNPEEKINDTFNKSVSQNYINVLDKYIDESIYKYTFRKVLSKG